MANKETYNYVQFPLNLLQELPLNKEATIKKMICFGVYKYAQNLKAAHENIAKQIIYGNYKDKLPIKLSEKLESIDFVEVGMDLDYHGFMSGDFAPTAEVLELTQWFIKDEELLELAKEYYQVHQAIYLMNLNLSVNECIEIAKPIFNNPFNDVNNVMPMAKVSSLVKFHDNKLTTKKDLIGLMGFIAVRSILGTKKCVKTNKNHILSRLLGFKSVSEIPDKLPNHLNEIFTKYKERHHMDKLLIELQLNWQILIYSKRMRGLYLSTLSKMTLNELVFIAESNKQKNREKELKNKKSQAEAFALEKLKQSTKLYKLTAA